MLGMPLDYQEYAPGFQTDGTSMGAYDELPQSVTGDMDGINMPPLPPPTVRLIHLSSPGQ